MTTFNDLELKLIKCDVVLDQGVEGNESIEKDLDELFTRHKNAQAKCIVEFSHSTYEENGAMYLSIKYYDKDKSKDETLLMICIDDVKNIDMLRRYLKIVSKDIRANIQRDN